MSLSSVQLFEHMKELIHKVNISSSEEEATVIWKDITVIGRVYQVVKQKEVQENKLKSDSGQLENLPKQDDDADPNTWDVLM